VEEKCVPVRGLERVVSTTAQGPGDSWGLEDVSRGCAENAAACTQLSVLFPSKEAKETNLVIDEGPKMQCSSGI
jgi:hypothetical protein